MLQDFASNSNHTHLFFHVIALLFSAVGQTVHIMSQHLLVGPSTFLHSLFLRHACHRPDGGGSLHLWNVGLRLWNYISRFSEDYHLQGKTTNS